MTPAHHARDHAATFATPPMPDWRTFAGPVLSPRRIWLGSWRPARSRPYLERAITMAAGDLPAASRQGADPTRQAAPPTMTPRDRRTCSLRRLARMIHGQPRHERRTECDNACALVALSCGGRGRAATVTVRIDRPLPGVLRPAISTSQPGRPLPPSPIPSKRPSLSITWQIVSPALAGIAIAYRHFRDGSNQWWTAVQVRNHRNPVARFECAAEGGAWIEVPPHRLQLISCRSEPRDGTWVRTHSSAATDSYGNVLIGSSIPRPRTETASGAGQPPAGPPRQGSQPSASIGLLASGSSTIAFVVAVACPKARLAGDVGWLARNVSVSAPTCSTEPTAMMDGR